jgi:hypothetical protein
MLFPPYDGHMQVGFHHLFVRPSSTQGETQASGQTRSGALSNRQALLALRLQEVAAWAPGLTGCGHRSPCAPNNMYLSAESIPSPPDLVARPKIHT